MAVIQSLNENPIVTVPIVLRRLQQKDAEWRAARMKWSCVWEEENEKNYYRSLDHQSGNFKAKEKKLLNPRELLAEIKEDFGQTPANPESDTLSYTMKDSLVLKDIAQLINVQSQRMGTSTGEPEKMAESVQSFINQFFVSEGQDGSKADSFGLFFGNNSFYVFFRFYQLLYERLSEARAMSEVAFSKQSPVDVTKSLMASFSPKKDARQHFDSAGEIYNFFLDKVLRPLIEGTTDSNRYEDSCRELFGISSYVLFTLDRLLHVLVKSVCSCTPVKTPF